MIETSRLELAGVATRALIAGDTADARATVLCFHGWSDSADSWKPLFAHLADADARLVALDLPHFGRADDLKPGAMLPQFIAFIRAALDRFGEQGPVLPIGQSLGGRVLLMTLAQPGAPQPPAAVAIGPAPLQLPAWQRMLVRNFSLGAAVSALANPVPLRETIDEIVKSYRRTCFAAPDAVPAYVYEEYAGHYDARRLGRHFESLRQLGAELEEPLALDGVRCPVELVWGTHDRMAPFAGAQRYVEALPQAQIVKLEGCGHHAHIERADAVAEVIRRRLRAAAS